MHRKLNIYYNINEVMSHTRTRAAHTKHRPHIEQFVHTRPLKTRPSTPVMTRSYRYTLAPSQPPLLTTHPTVRHCGLRPRKMVIWTP